MPLLPLPRLITLVRCISLCCFSVGLWASAPAAPVDSGFVADFLNLDTTNGKTKVVFDPAGRMYVTEKRGRLLLANPDGEGGFNAFSELLDIRAEVDSGLEAGILGFEIDPNYATNRFIYLFYTTPEEELWDGTGDQRLVRYTMNATFDAIEAGSETILLSGLPRIVNFHKAGEIGIHPLDPYAIFIALGDDDQIGGGGTLPQNLDSYVGKILRVDTSTGLGLADNPHFNGDPDSVRSRVWARGTRNPFSFAFHPDRADIIYISENGDGTDRLAMVKAGGNGLWNGDDDGGFLTVDTPSFKVMATTSPSLIGVEIMTSGPFAHNGQPTLYLGNWLDGVSRYTLSDSTDAQDNEWDTATGIAGGGAFYWDADATAMDLQRGADGHLYFTQTGGDASEGGWYPVRRFRYVGGTPPDASFNLTPTGSSGALPYQVNFTDTSTAGTNSITSWLWDFGDGTTSTQEDPTHSFVAEGSYTVTLTVTDSVGLNSTHQQTLEVTLDTPMIFDLNVYDGRSLPAVAAAQIFTISLYQIDGSTPLAFAGGTGANGNQLQTLADGTLNVSRTLPLIADGYVMVLEASSSPAFQQVVRGIVLTAGASASTTHTFYVSTTTLSGTVLSHAGVPALVDVVARSSNAAVNFAGGRDASASSLLPASASSNRVSVDELGYFSIALPTTHVSSTVDLSFAEDTGRNTYAARSMSIIAAADTAHDASIVLGEWRGGPADDLSGQAYTPNIDYSAIQAIFSANCTGCHRATTSNNGGLDLTNGFSYAELVGQPSLFVPGLNLVEPGSPSRSYLFEKINSAAPQQGARMRPSDSLPLADQALIRDWITQLAPSYENYVWTNLGVAPGGAGTGVGDTPAGSTTSNGLAYTQPAVGMVSIPAAGPVQGRIQLNANITGLTLVIQASSDLGASGWTTVATRLRGQTNWRVSSGFSVNETSPGVLDFSEAAPGGNQRFYRFGVSQD